MAIYITTIQLSIIYFLLFSIRIAIDIMLVSSEGIQIGIHCYPLCWFFHYTIFPIFIAIEENLSDQLLITISSTSYFYWCYIPLAWNEGYMMIHTWPYCIKCGLDNL